MIVYTRDDVVKLSGSLVRSEWLTIKAACNLLLKEHPEGIIIDCADLGDVAGDGARTFSDAMRDIRSAGARIVVCNLPDNVLAALRSIPGVKSQLPIATSIEAARNSLRRSSDEHDEALRGCIVVPLAAWTDAGLAVETACRIAKEKRLSLVFIAYLAVARQLALATPLPDQETEATALVDRAVEDARRLNVIALGHVERVRNVDEGLLMSLREHAAAVAVIAINSEFLDDGVVRLANDLMRRAECAITVTRGPINPAAHSQP